MKAPSIPSWPCRAVNRVAQALVAPRNFLRLAEVKPMFPPQLVTLRSFTGAPHMTSVLVRGPPPQRAVGTAEAPVEAKGFPGLGLAPELLAALADMNLTSPTPIQVRGAYLTKPTGTQLNDVNLNLKQGFQ